MDHSYPAHGEVTNGVLLRLVDDPDQPGPSYRLPLSAYLYPKIPSISSINFPLHVNDAWPWRILAPLTWNLISPAAFNEPSLRFLWSTHREAIGEGHCDLELNAQAACSVLRIGSLRRRAGQAR